MISSIVSRLVILVFGTLYPAYASYKAVRTKNVKEYVKWMMYWIVFALFTCAETFTDVFLSFWFPFYYEIKIILVLWLLSPATKGSSILYRKFVHPMFSRREQEIDDYIAKAKEQGYHTVLHLGTKGVNYATTVLMQTAIKGGGGLVNQIRRSYSLSDLSSDKESDMNRNSKALKNVSDEDDMEETDGLDPRMLKPRGYSPRRSASGSSRMEMYFPEVDVDVLQHGSSRPREPTIPLSHIRSTEDVSSGYSSAEPLYAGHHATKSEGLVTSGEPLVRTASVGSTRSMRTKSSRGGVVVKRGSAGAAAAAEDSEFLDLQNDEADYHYQEDYFNYILSSLSSQASKPVPFPASLPVNRSAAPLSSVPEISFSSAQRQVVLIPSKLNDMSAQVQYIDDSDVKSNSPDDEDMPLYDAESDESKTASNELLPLEPLVPLVNDDFICTESHETALSIDVTMLHLDRAVNDKIHDTAISSGSFVLSNECLTSHLDTTTNNTAPDNLAAPADDFIVDKIFTEKRNEVSIQEESPLLNVKDLPCEQINSQHVEAEPKTLVNKAYIVSGSLEAKTQNLDIVSDSLKHINPSSVAHPTHMFPEVTDDLGTTSGISDVVKETVGKDEPSVSELKELNTVANETVTETLPAVVMSTLTVTCSESLFLDNTVDISLESQDCICNIGVKQSNNSVDNNCDLNCTHIDADRQTTVPLKGVECETPKLNKSSVISTCSDGSGETLQKEDSDVTPLQDYVGSAYASVESLALPDPPSRSSSQGSLRKEGRAGRYHKRPAPTPPPKNSELESEDWAEVRDSQMLCDANSKAVAWPKELDGDEPSLKATKCEDSESAVTARLVLKPGVVKSLGPDSETRAEIFVSRTPQMKSKNSKSKSKQGDSALSRLFVHPKNQLGGFSSFFPFWHGKQEAHAPSDIQIWTPESSALKGSNSSAFVAVQEDTSCGSKMDKSSHSSYVNVKEMSCSPGKKRRAPLADWE